jgi:hypothetical protein
MKTASQSICLLMVLLSSLTWAAYETEEPVDFTLMQLGGSEVAE